MSGYRCVNFTDLCRLCSGAGSNNVHIFSDESLQKKISDCIPITLNEKDKLPKVICTTCLEYVEIFSDFRHSCTKAQKMLESCLNTSKLRNGGQVYIKDEVPTKKVLKPIQSPSTKLIPNLCNIVNTTPTKQIKKNFLTSPNPSDSLSNIMQIVGIQSNDETTENISISQNIQPQQTMQPQYTFTLDGGTLKAGQIHYKIENSGNLNVASPQQVITKNIQDVQSQQLDSFLKLNKKSVEKILMKKNPVTVTQVDDPKNKKPKFNLILASPSKPKVGAQIPQKSFGAPTALTSPVKSQIQIHNIEKIMPPTNQPSPTKQLVLPIMVRNDGSRNNETAQLISQAIAMSNNQTNMENKNQANQPFAYVQMKIQPDGQFSLTPAPNVSAPQHLQLALSPQQFTNLSFQTPQQQQTQTLTMQPQITVTQLPAQEQADRHTQTPTQAPKAESHDDENSFQNNEEDFFYTDEHDDSNGEETEEKPTKSAVTIIKKKQTKSEKRAKSEDLTELQSVHQEHSDVAKKQLNQLTSYNIKKEQKPESDTEKPSDLNLTVCDVCKKIFKRKEFLMQHLKSHIGLRPFKCDDPGCNKSFSRKEHLLRHVVSHTGQKMFNCDVCKKLFSRKDNLNKHRRIHPESGQQSVRHSCPNCNKGFSHRAQLAKHQIICDGKSDGNEAADDVSIKEEKFEDEEVVETKIAAKKMKMKTEKKPSVVLAKPAVAVSSNQSAVQVSPPQQQTQHQQLVTFLQQPQQQLKLKQDVQQPQQIIISMTQAQAMFQQKNAIYTFPTNLSNLVLSNGAYMTNSADMVNMKFDNP